LHALVHRGIQAVDVVASLAELAEGSSIADQAINGAGRAVNYRGIEVVADLATGTAQTTRKHIA
jgi:hypothetical protein